MKIKYDSKIDAKYVTIKSGKVASTKPINDWLFFDVNKNGEVLGVEILDASVNYVTLQTDGDNLVAIEIYEPSFRPSIKFAKEISLGGVYKPSLQYA
jgi:uncharacterized protein YuzE